MCNLSNSKLFICIKIYIFNVEIDFGNYQSPMLLVVKNVAVGMMVFLMRLKIVAQRMDNVNVSLSLMATSVTRFSHICAVIKTKLDHSKFKLPLFSQKLIAHIFKDK